MMTSTQDPEVAAMPETPQSIDATPRVGQSIDHEGIQYTTIQEGLAHILVPRGTPTSTDPKMSKEETQKQQVFYNPIQQFNRDLSVLAIKTFSEDMVQRRTEKHEQQRKKAEKQGEKKKRKLDMKLNDEGQSDTLESGDQPLKRRRTTENGDEHPANPSADTEGGTSILPVNTQGEAIVVKSQDEPEWKPTFSILDALSATGLRALRYAKEIPATTSITANDLSSKAVAAIALNVKHNKLEAKIKANTGNAMAHMYSFIDQKGYDVIDLDPYGTAAPFLDASIHAINDGGLLCVTCTDSAIFASHGYLEKTYSQYGGLPFKGEPCHEGGLRLILHAIAQSAGRYGKAIEPLLSLSIDYYIRVFVRVRKSPSDVKLLAGKTMLVHHCQNGCGSWTTQFLARNRPKLNKDGTSSYKYGYAQGPSANQHCEHCGTKTHLTGPMYGGPLHNVGFIQRVLAQLNVVDRGTYPTMDRIQGMLHTAMEEVTFGAQNKESTEAKDVVQLDGLIPKTDPAVVDNAPFFFIPSAVAKVVHCQAPPTAAMRGALRHAGFQATMSHCKPGSIRTNAPWAAIWHIMLEWVRQKSPLKKSLKKETAGYAIMSKATAHQVNEEQPKSLELEKANDESPEAAPETLEENGDSKGQDPDSKTENVDKPQPSYLDKDFEVIFDEQLGRDQDRGKYVRFQLAPRENWGPMSRAR